MPIEPLQTTTPTRLKVSTPFFSSLPYLPQNSRSRETNANIKSSTPTIQAGQWNGRVEESEGDEQEDHSNTTVTDTIHMPLHQVKIRPPRSLSALETPQHHDEPHRKNSSNNSQPPSVKTQAKRTSTPPPMLSNSPTKNFSGITACSHHSQSQQTLITSHLPPQNPNSKPGEVDDKDTRDGLVVLESLSNMSGTKYCVVEGKNHHSTVTRNGGGTGKQTTKNPQVVRSILDGGTPSHHQPNNNRKRKNAVPIRRSSPSLRSDPSLTVKRRAVPAISPSLEEGKKDLPASPAPLGCGAEVSYPMEIQLGLGEGGGSRGSGNNSNASRSRVTVGGGGIGGYKAASTGNPITKYFHVLHTGKSDIDHSVTPNHKTINNSNNVQVHSPLHTISTRQIQKQSHKPQILQLEAQIQTVQSQNSQLQSELADAQSQLKALSSTRTLLHNQLQTALRRTESKLKEVTLESESFRNRAAGVVEDMLRREEGRRQREERERLAREGVRLGRWVGSGTRGLGMMAKTGIESIWEDGYGVRECKKRKGKLKRRKEVLEERLKKGGMGAKEVDATSDIAEDGVKEGTDRLEREEFQESVHIHLQELRREERGLDREEKRLFEEKATHKRALKRIASEDSSRFKHRPKLHDRYVLLSQLGRGGFSEVWRAYDLNSLRFVAVKIHQLDPRWSQAKIDNYAKHVSREYEIHRHVRHPRIVSLYDVFEIDYSSFATVLECCNGTDLDALLVERKRLEERHARVILLQILEGMQYLSNPEEGRPGIIHYDLKPGNILFDEFGDAKITDFGLSKIMDSQDPGGSMELTSQGAGTLWYLPPECFVTDVNVRITNKVDVWSIGVIFYQMLFGKRPFGEGQSQEKVWSNGIMLNARDVQFPDKPLVTEGCKEFIVRCLAYDQSLRPSIAELCECSYVICRMEKADVIVSKLTD